MKSINSFGVVSSLILLLCCPLTVGAQPGSDAPTIVTVGMYVSRIHNLDIRSQYFDAEFYLWLKWKGAYSAERYEFPDAIKVDRLFEVPEEDTSGFRYISVKIRGTFVNPMDVSDYPQDKHILTIAIEDYNWTEAHLKYEIDTVNTKMEQQPEEDEWKLRFIGAEVASRELLNADERFSSFRFHCEAKRSVSPFLVKILIPIIIVVLMSMLTFFIPPMHLETQVSLGATALLTIIALNLVIADELPDVAYLTNADILLIGSYLIVFLALCESILTSILHRRRKTELSRLIDRACRLVFPAAYAVFLLSLFAL